MKISIITEGFQNTGYGHITRCLSLYQAFEELQLIPSLYLNTDENAIPFLGNTEYKVIDWLTHPTRLINDIINSDILIIDSYFAGKEFYEIMSKLSKVSMYIDDYMRLDYPEGIIMNGTINSESLPYNKNSNSEYLLGSYFIPLRKEFWKNEKRKIGKNISSILITFGGQDVKNLTPQATRAIQQAFPSATKKIVLGSNTLPQKEIEKLKDGNTEIHFSVSAAKMKELMLSSDIAVSAAGQTLYELAATGTPTIAVAVADNQKNNILEWKKVGFLLDAIFHGDHNFLKKVTKQIETLHSTNVRKKLIASGTQNVDGQGSKRVVEYLISKLCDKELFYFRKAGKNDSQIIYELSNDPEVRRQSINQNPIDWDDHQMWFNIKLNDINYIFFLAFERNSFIAQVRFEINNESAIISISIEKEFRGKSLSSKLIARACEKLFSERIKVQEIFAYIRSENIASVRGFESAKFFFINEELIKNDKFLKYSLQRNSN